MKRLGVLVTIFVATISIFGGFSAPEKAHAAFESAQAAIIKTFTDATFPVNNKYTAQQNADYALYINKLRSIVATKAVELAGTAHDNDSYAQNVFIDFKKYLDTTLSNLSSPTADQKKVISDTQELLSAYGMAGYLGSLDQSFLNAMAGGAGVVQSQPDVAADAAANAANAAANGSTKKDVCSISFKPGENMSITACISEGITWIVKNVFLEIAGFLVWAAANMFNYAVQIGILNFAQWAPDALYPIWIIIRQILSLLIVFVGLYLGFLYILGRDPEKFEKYIPWVVIFALFVNFSYPLARTAVDISNIVSLKIYASAVGVNAINAPTDSITATAGGLIMNRLGLQGLVASSVNKTGATANLMKDVTSVPGSLMVVAFVLYAAYVFLIATGIMIMRTISLVFIIVASPFLLIDSVLPMLGEKAKQLRKIFFEQLAVGPVFMVMLALTLKFLEVFSTAMTTAANGVGTAGIIAQFFNLTMMLVMLHIMLKITKSIAGEVGTYGTNAMGKVGGFGLGVATGGAGLLARGTMGAAASKMRDSSWVKNNQDSFIGRRAYDLTNSVAKSTFDLRNSTVVAGKMNKIGMGMGMGSKLGYDQAVEAKRKDVTERGARITTRHERDVYAKDGTLLKRKGDTDEAGQAAKNRFIQTAGGTLLGGTRFMTKEQKKTRDALGDKENEEKAKIIADNKSKSTPDVEKYRAINEKMIKDMKISGTTSQVRADFLNNLKTELEGIKATDPNLLGSQAQSLIQSIQTIEEGLADEKFADYKAINENKLRKDGTPGTVKDAKAAFYNNLQKELAEIKTKDPQLESKHAKSLVEAIEKIEENGREETLAFEKQVEDALFKYNSKAKNKDDQEKFLTNLSENIATAVRSKAMTQTIAGFDTTKLQQGLSRNAEGESSPMRTGTGTESLDIDLTQPHTPEPLDIDLDAPFNVEEDLQTMTFAQKAAAKRKAKLAESAAVARQNMGSNGSEGNTQASSPVPERPTPPSAPSGAARPMPQSPSNDPRVAQAA